MIVLSRILCLLYSVIMMSLICRYVSVRELDIPFLVVDLEHAVDQVHELFVHYGQDQALFLQTQLFKPVLHVLDCRLIP